MVRESVGRSACASRVELLAPFAIVPGATATMVRLERRGGPHNKVLLGPHKALLCYFVV